MKITTMLNAFEQASYRRTGIYAKRNRQYHAIRDGIHVRYLRLQAENAKLVSLAEQIADLLKSIPSPEEVALMQAENARLRAELEQANKKLALYAPHCRGDLHRWPQGCVNGTSCYCGKKQWRFDPDA